MSGNKPGNKLLSRRAFVALSAAALAVSAGATLTVPAQARSFYDPKVRKLSFYNTHTNERVSGTFWANGEYDNTVLRQFATVLRDHRTGDISRIDPKLYDLLHKLQTRLNNHDTLHIISGYRSPRSNRWLASQSNGVAKNSYHTRGQAIDIRMTSEPTPYIQRAALSLQSGGVGYYRSSDFVHVDTGPVRSW